MSRTTDVRFHLLVRRLVSIALLAGGLVALLLTMEADAVALLAAVGGHPESLPAAAQPAGMMELTSGTYMDGFGAWSPDGTQIAFMRDGRIEVMAAKGGPARPLTKKSEGWDLSPAFSPSGREIAFVRLFAESKRSQIVVADLRSGRERVVVSQQEPIGYLAFGPKSGDLYYTLSKALIRLRGGRQEPVYSAGADWEMAAGGIAIAPDERELLFGAGPRDEQGTHYDLYRLSLEGEGAHPERITRAGGIMPNYHPSGRLVVYRNPRAATGIYRMNLAEHTTDPVLADTPSRMYFHPAFAPDGKRLVVSALSLSAVKGEGAGLTSHLFVLRADG